MAKLSTLGWIATPGHWFIFPKPLLRHLKSDVAVLILCEVANQARSQGLPEEEWFQCGCDVIEEELGYHRNVQRGAIKKLVDAGFVETKFEGMDRRRWWKVDLQKVEAIINPGVTPAPKWCNGTHSQGASTSTKKVHLTTNKKRKNNTIKATLEESGEKPSVSNGARFNGTKKPLNGKKGLIPSLKKKHEPSVPEEFDRFAVQIKTTLKTHRKRGKKASRRKDADLLFDIGEDFTVKEISETIAWWGSNIDGAYVPGVCTVEEFCDKFSKLRAKMKREEKKVNSDSMSTKGWFDD